MAKEFLRPEIYQRVRCLQCRQRMALEPGQKEVYCPSCGEGWVIVWLTEGIPHILRRIKPHYLPGKE